MWWEAKNQVNQTQMSKVELWNYHLILLENANPQVFAHLDFPVNVNLGPFFCFALPVTGRSDGTLIRGILSNTKAKPQAQILILWHPFYKNPLGVQTHTLIQTLLWTELCHTLWNSACVDALTTNVTTQRWSLQEVIQVKWGQEGGPWSDRTVVLLEEEEEDLSLHLMRAERRQLCASQKEHWSEYTNAGTWTVLPASETVRKPFLKIKPPNLWNSVIATQADLHTHTPLENH